MLEIVLGLQLKLCFEAGSSSFAPQTSLQHGHLSQTETSPASAFPRSTLQSQSSVIENGSKHFQKTLPPLASRSHSRSRQHLNDRHNFQQKPLRRSPHLQRISLRRESFTRQEAQPKRAKILVLANNLNSSTPHNARMGTCRYIFFRAKERSEWRRYFPRCLETLD